MRILVIGSGAREHALLLGLSQDPAVSDLHVVPGNAGMADLATLHKGTVTDPAEMTQLATSLDVDLVVIGPEIPLVAGVADALREKGIKVFGPNKDAARIEGSKAFAKDVMAAAGVKTAHAEALAPGASNDDIEAALNRFGPTWVVKDDGLAGGKGVVVTPDRDAARAHVDAVHAAGNPVLLETFLDGPEVSLFCLVDGETVVPLLPAQDHKRVGNNDEGPNTGGMGAYSPAPVVTPAVYERAMNEIILPTVAGMKAEGHEFTGFLYAGLMIDQSGAPYTIEFNCRFGDPETQPIMSRLNSDLADLVEAAIDGKLDSVTAEWNPQTAVGVVLAAQNYPETPKKGDVISGLDAANQIGKVFHAGTTANEKGDVLTNGGRVLCVVGLGDDVAQAKAKAYSALEKISFDGMQYRKDIADKAINR